MDKLFSLRLGIVHLFEVGLYKTLIHKKQNKKNKQYMVVRMPQSNKGDQHRS